MAARERYGRYRGGQWRYTVTARPVVGSPDQQEFHGDFFRFVVGLADTEDIITDMEQMFSTVAG